MICKKKKKEEFPKYFLENDDIITDDQGIADCFNDFFVNIGPNLSNKISPPDGKSFKDFLTSSISSSFTFSLVTEEEVLKIIKKLKPKSSYGHDGVSTILLKFIASNISILLTKIINQSLCTGIFPDKLKIAKVKPIYKKDDPHLPDNYRPISLLPAISKVFEKVAYIQLYNYLKENELLYQSQYGFRQLHSTELATLELTDKIYMSLDDKKIPLAIFLDLSKAFDTIDHSILMYKLKHYGIQGSALNWFKSYLTNRIQHVEFNNKTSNSKIIETGVPQGSILGPLLFIIYMNDISNVTDKFHFTLYADDTSLVEPLCTYTLDIKDTSALSNSINKELCIIYEWMSLNKLSLNVKKTKMMIFHNRQRNIDNIVPKLEMNSIPIEHVKQFNFLGITLDEQMTWKPHINKVACKVARTIGTMNRLKRFLPQTVLKTLYNSLILPHLNYGILTWGVKPGRLQKLQKWAIRTMTCSKYNAHTEPIFKKHGLLKIVDLYYLNALKFYFKSKQNLLPKYFTNIFLPNPHSTHHYNTRNRNETQIRQSNTVLVSLSIRYNVPRIIQSAPMCIIDKIATHSIDGFCLYAKNYIISSYKFECDIDDCYICSQ